MNFQAIFALASSLLSNPALKHISQYILPLAMEVETGSGILTVEGFTITATQEGSAVKFTLPQLLIAVEMVAAGSVGSIQIGTTEITVKKN